MTTTPNYARISRQLAEIQKELDSWKPKRNSQKKILKYLRADKPITTEQLAKKANLARTQVNRAISHLMVKGVVEPVGRGVYQLSH